MRLPGLKPSHCRCQYQLQASSGWLAVGLACQGQLLAAGLAMPFKASGRPSRQFQASSRPTPALRGGFALAFARLETLPLPLPISVPRPGPIAHSAGACAQQALRCPSRLAAGEVGSFRLAAGLAMPFKASGRPSRQFQASSRPTPALRGSFALAFARLETLPLPLPKSVPRPGPIAHSAGACAQQALRCPSRLAAGEVGSFRLAARQQAK